MTGLLAAAISVGCEMSLVISRSFGRVAWWPPQSLGQRLLACLQWFILPDLLFQYTIPLLLLGLSTWLLIELFWRTRKAYQIRQGLILRTVTYPLCFLTLLAALLAPAVTLAQIAVDWAGWRGTTAETVLYGPYHASNAAGLLLYYLSLGLGWRRHLKVERGWHLVGLVLVLQIALAVFAVTEITLAYGSFDNPIAQFFGELLPPFWSYW